MSLRALSPTAAARRRASAATADLLDHAREELAARYLPTALDLAAAGHAALRVLEQVGDAALVGVTGQRRYRDGTIADAGLAYLVHLDAGARPHTVVRVPATLTTVAEAAAWTIPAEVLRAEERGRRVLSHGAVWALRTQPQHDSPTGSYAGAWWDARRRELTSPGAGPRHVPWPARILTPREFTSAGATRTG